MCSPHHGDPAQCWDALTDSRQVVKEAAATVTLPKTLDQMDLLRYGFQQVRELCLGGGGDGGEGNKRRGGWGVWFDLGENIIGHSQQKL